MTDERLPAGTRVGAVHLRAHDLDALADFYVGTLGLRTLRRAGDRIELGADEPFLILHDASDALARPAGSTGLFHAAILLPDRRALGRILQHFAQTQFPLQGASDHLVSEALYLADPEGNGLEIYADRPREAWRWRGGGIEMATMRMDVAGVLAEADGPWTGMPDGTRMGHVHLEVARVPEAEAFYDRALGLDLMARYGSDASFLAAGRYHHHVAVNQWQARGGPRPPEGALGLDRFELLAPPEAVDAAADRLAQTGAETGGDGVTVVDPSGNRVVLRKLQ